MGIPMGIPIPTAALATQDFIVGDVIAPADVEYPSLTSCMEGVQTLPVMECEGPDFRAIEEYRQHAGGVYTKLCWCVELLLVPDPVQSFHSSRSESDTSDVF